MAHKLLLADDSPTIQRVVELTFANENIDVVAVGDGAQAIEAIERDEPDIVLADVSMPGKDGYEVASFVRLDPARARIPVVLLTGAFEPLDTARCDAIGRHEVLVKPFDPREVIGKVRELLALPAAGPAKTPTIAAPLLEPATGISDGTASDESAAGAGEAPAAAHSEASAEDDIEAASAAVVEEAEAGATDAVEAVPRDASARDEKETPAVEEVDVSEEASSAVQEASAQAAEVSSTEDGADPDPTSAAVAAVAEEGPAEHSTAGTSDAPLAPGVEDAATPSEGVDPESGAAAADPDGPPASPPDRTAEVEDVAQPTGDEIPGGAGRVQPAGDGGSVLAQSFVTFLAVEQGAAPPVLPVAGAAADSDAEPLLPEAVMDDLVAKVVERLTDTVLRDTVAEVVSRLAERLAREEITRVPRGRE